MSNLYVKNANGDRCLVFVTADFEVVASKEGSSLEGFDTETIYCLGCSWSGTVKKLVRYIR